MPAVMDAIRSAGRTTSASRRRATTCGGSARSSRKSAPSISPPVGDMAMMINADGQARDVIVVGASAGGVQALMHLLSKLPGDLPAIIGIVLHRAPYYETRLPWVLGLHAALKTLE